MKLKGFLLMLGISVFPSSLLANTLYFPQVVFGSGYSTTFVIENTGAADVTSPLNFYAQNGALRTDLSAMLRAINPRRIMIESKAVQSVRSAVGNLREMLPGNMTIDDLRAAILREIFGEGPIPELRLQDEEWRRIEEISASRYATWDWNYGRSPQFNVQKSGRLPIGKVDARIEVNEGIIRSIRLFGDFSGKRDVAELEAGLVGTPYDRERLAAALAETDLDAYFGRMDVDAFINLIY